MKKKIVIIGAGVEQAYAYHLAHNSGHYIIATDSNPDAPAVKLSDHFIKVSTKDADKTLIALQEYCSENGLIDGVMTIANDVPYTVACVAEFFSLPGHSVDSALISTNKLHMKQAFKTNGVACPEFWEVRSASELKTILRQERVDLFVLKPLDGCGARGVLLLKSTDDIDWAWRESLNWSKCRTLLLERFVSGLQISSESFIISGKANTPAISERNYSRLTQFSPFIIEDGGTIPAPISEGLKKKIDHLIEEGAKAMGVSDGIIKGDIVIDENGDPLIIELALRLSGGWFASDQIIAATGVDLVKAVMNQALGESVSENDLSAKKNKATSIRYWFPKSGKIRKIRGENLLQKTPGLLKYGFFRKSGEIQPTIHMHPDRFGYVLVEGADRIEVISRVEKAISCLNIDMECL
jgi:biotin carboxylase